MLTLLHGDCLEKLKELPDCSVDAVVTDPPYGLEFMGKEWDSFKGEAWRSSAGMTKPGIGERQIPWPSFGGSDNANATCATCGGRMRGSKKCECETPDWHVKGKPLSERNNKSDSMRAFQHWCEKWAAECLRVLKPGGHLLAFGGTRTYHRMACAIEDAGFEIRDSIHWMYGSGFPKSLDVSKAIDKAAGAERPVIGKAKAGALSGNSKYNDAPVGTISRDHVNPTQGYKCGDIGEYDVTAPATDSARQWAGFGTALKPAHEPIVMARKPLVGTVAENVLAFGVSGINIDGCRVATLDDLSRINLIGDNGWKNSSGGPNTAAIRKSKGLEPLGRWPPNVIFSHLPECLETECADGCAVRELDEQSGIQHGTGAATIGGPPRKKSAHIQQMSEKPRNNAVMSYGDSGGASRFFPAFRYQAKAPRSERNDGLEDHSSANIHPTVKPVDLMLWLVRLVTPPKGTVLDPFMGSGSTGVAAIEGDFKFVGIERESEYFEIAQIRINETRARTFNIDILSELPQE